MNKEILKNIFYKFILIFFRIISPILLIPYIYRQIDINEMGKINFIISFSTVFYMISDLGIYNLGLRSVSSYRENKEKLDKKIAEIMELKNIILISMLLIYFIVLWYLSYLKVEFIISSFMIISLFFHVEWILEGIEEFNFITRKTIAVRILSFICMFIFVKGEKAGFYYLIITVGFYLLNNICSFYYLKIKGYNLKLFKIKRKNSLKQLKQLIYIAFISNINLFIFSYDKIVLGLEKKNKYVATYSLVEKLITMISTMVALTFIQVYLPKLISLTVDRKEEYQSKLTELINISCLIAFPSTVGLYSIQKEVILIFGGEEYLNYIIVFKVLIIYILIYVFFEILKTNIYLAINLEKVFFIISMLITLPIWLLKIIYIKNLSIVEFLILTIFNFILIILVSSYYIYKKKQIKIFNKNCLINLLISLPLLLSTRFNCPNIVVNLLYKILFSISLYLILLLIFYYSKIKQLIFKIFKKNTIG